MKTTLSGPIVIGGVGGSGTRVVAEILIASGFYFGSKLNDKADNLWFSSLFKRPNWFAACAQNNPSEILKAIGMFEQMMHCHFQSKRVILQTALKRICFKQSINPDPIRRRIKAIKKFPMNRKNPLKYVGWGWKEPNSHVYLEYLNEYFPNMKYIHMIRNGFDMTYSKNQNQLKTWGKLYGVKTPEGEENSPKASLEYWIRANQKAIEYGKKTFGERFLLMKFEDICTSSEAEIERLRKFVSQEEWDIQQLKTLVKPPSSLGRYKNQDNSAFSSDQLAAVETLSYAL